MSKTWKVLHLKQILTPNYFFIMGFLYILQCADGTFYTGSTKDIDRRILEHQGGVGSINTSNRLPICLVYFEQYDRIDHAFYREKQIQGWSRKKKEALIDGEPQLLPILAKKIFRS